MDPIISWLALPVVLLYLAATFIFLILYAIYRMASRRDLLTPGETLFGVLMMIGLPVLGSLAVILYTYHRENQELKRASQSEGEYPSSVAWPEDELDLSERERQRRRKRPLRR